MFDSQIDSIISSNVETKELDLLNYQPSVGSLSTSDQFSSDEIYRFWMNSRNIKESNISGNENFLGEFLRPSSDNVLLSGEMLDLMVEYYIATYDNLDFWKILGEGSENAIIIRVKMN